MNSLFATGVQKCTSFFTLYKKLIVTGTLSVLVGVGAWWVFVPHTPAWFSASPLNLDTVRYSESKQFGFRIHRWTTAEGTDVYCVPTTNIPMVQVSLLFPAGYAWQQKEDSIALLTARMLEASSTADVAAITDKLEAVGAIYEKGIRQDYARINLTSLSKPEYLVVATDVVREILASPRFVEADFIRLRNAAVNEAQQISAYPSEIAQRAVYQALYPEHPYRFRALGSPELLSAVTLEQVKAFFEQHYAANQAKIVIVGDLTLRQADALAKHLITGLPTKAPVLTLPVVDKLPSSAKIHQDLNVQQMQIYLAATGAFRAEDYYSLIVGNDILGGSTSGRLFQVLREAQGLGYNPYTDIGFGLQSQPFWLSIQTDAKSATQSVQQMQHLKEDFLQKGPTPQEVQAAQRRLIGELTLNLASNQQLLEAMVPVAFYNLPLNYYFNYAESVKKVTPDSVTAAFKKHFPDQHWVQVLVGPTG